MGLIEQLLQKNKGDEEEDDPLVELIELVLDDLHEIESSEDEDEDEDEEDEDEDEEDPRAQVLLKFAEEVAALVVHSCPGCNREEALCFGCHIKSTLGERAMLAIPEVLPQLGGAIKAWREGKKE